MTAVCHHYVLSANAAVSVPSHVFVIGVALLVIVVGSVSVFAPVFVTTIVFVVFINVVFVLGKRENRRLRTDKLGRVQVCGRGTFLDLESVYILDKYFAQLPRPCNLLCG